MGAAGSAGGVPLAHVGLGDWAHAANGLHVLPCVDMADRAVFTALAGDFGGDFWAADDVEPELYHAPAPGAGDCGGPALINVLEGDSDIKPNRKAIRFNVIAL